MIRIKFEKPTTRVWRRWIKDCETATTNLKDSYRSGKPAEITDLYRRKSVKDEVYLAKSGPFKGRCAYCESNITDFQHGDIEHFRPKKAVTDENDMPVKVAWPDGTEGDHPGYYWLAYSWLNLLPSCTTCNQPGEEGIGKRNRFPVVPPPHATSEETIAEEKPLLVNPIDPKDDDPEDHLGIDLKTGLLTYKNQSKRGEMCVKIFGLNKRDQLVQERRAAINEVKAKYAEIIFGDATTASEASQQLEAMEAGALNCTLARRAQIKQIRDRMAL